MMTGENNKEFDWEATTPQGKQAIAVQLKKTLPNPQPEIVSPAKVGLNGLDSYFKIQSMNEVIEEAKNTIVPAQLFGSLWYEFEMVILVASAGVGKTLLAFQIADALSRGENPLPGAFIPNTIQPQIVAYFDLELSVKQIEYRYSNHYENHYQWSPNLYRVHINPDAELPDSVKHDEFIMKKIEATLLEIGAKILIVDNITYFRDDQEKAKDALRMMKQLKVLKSKLGLSILILAHTPKRDNAKPITRNDISGSSMIINFTDSAFAIGESALGKEVRYLKQLKPGRFASTVYDAENVITCNILNPDNFTMFKYMQSGGSESMHLTKKEDIPLRNDKIQTMRKQGASLRDIAESVNLTHTQVSRINKRYEKDNELPL
jgi:hypothetical protein